MLRGPRPGARHRPDARAAAGGSGERYADLARMGQPTLALPGRP